MSQELSLWFSLLDGRDPSTYATPSAHEQGAASEEEQLGLEPAIKNEMQVSQC